MAIASANSAPARRVIKEGRNMGLLIDMTHGREAKAMIIADSGHIILIAFAPGTIARRLQESRGSSGLASGVRS
jgi:hypothetical protein